MEVNDMNCAEVKKSIIEADGKFEKLAVSAATLAELNSHISSCEKCASLKRRMIEMTSAIALDRVPETPGLAAEISRRIFQPKQAPVIVQSEPGFFEKLASLLGIGREGFSPAFSAIAILLVVGAIAGYLYVKSLDSENGIIAVNETNKNQINPEVPKKQAVAVKENIVTPKEEQKKNNVGIFTVSSGKLAGNVPADFSGRLSVAEDSELKFNYKNAVNIALTPGTRFSFVGAGIELESGSLSADVYVKTKFTVATPEAIVEVTGTRFTVSRTNGETEISVTQGNVRVTDLVCCEVSSLTAGCKKSVSTKKHKKEPLKSIETIHETSPVVINAVTSEIVLHDDTVEVKSDTKVINLIDKLKNDNINGGK